jgi:ADP-ribosylglycohydrolase
MIGAISGDIIGSVYEWENIKTKQFDLFSPDCFFTDDTVLSVALAESILTDTDYAPLMRAYYRRYSEAAYGAPIASFALDRRSGEWLQRVGPPAGKSRYRTSEKRSKAHVR